MNAMKTALLVDDNDELRSATREYLEELGYSVITASDAGEALRVAGVSFDVLVSDIYMPGLSGIELADRWILRQPRLAVLLISSRGGEPEVRRRLGQGDVAFLAKPFSPEELATKIPEAMDRASRRDWVSSEANSGSVEKPDDLAVGSTSRWPRAAVQMVVAITFVLGLGALIRSLELGAPPLPAPAPGGVNRSLMIEAARPLGPLAATPEELVWQPVDGASSYSVNLSAVDGTVLWRAEVVSPPADLPAEVEGDLSSHVTYYWSVEAYSAGGQLLGRSELSPFVIEPTPSN